MSNKNEDRKKKGRRAGKIAGVISFFALSPLISGIISLGLVVAASVGVSKVIGTMAEGLDTTTHNKGDDERRQREAEEKRRAEEAAAEAKRRAEEEARRKAEANRIPLTGNAEADAVIQKGVEMLEQIRKANDAIPDAALSSQMDDLERVVTQMLKTVSDKPGKASQLRKFLNYYLPTTLKMLNNYRLMQDRGVSSGELVQARATLIRGMGMVLNACQKQLDNLFKDDILDVSTDMDVLEQMLHRDGFTDGHFNDVSTDNTASNGTTSARTAASAAMQSGAEPTGSEKQTDSRGSGDHPTI